MTVYVDDMEASYNPSHAPGRRYVMCHMIADTDRELHRMADKIGVARKWFQGDHYDITKSKKALAIKAGAKLIPVRTLSRMAINRRCGWPMGTPETCHKIAEKRSESRRRKT